MVSSVYGWLFCPHSYALTRTHTHIITHNSSPFSATLSVHYFPSIPVISPCVSKAVWSRGGEEPQGEKYHSFVQLDLSLTHVHAHTLTPKKQTKNGMGMFPAATLVAAGNQ